MKHPSAEVHEVLFFVIKSNRNEDHVELLRDIDVIVQQYPVVKVKVDPAEEELVISGEDELQLEEIGRKILQKYRVEISEVKIRFRETIRKSAEAEGKYIRQTGGLGNYGHVRIRLEPNEPGKGFEFLDAIKGGVVPHEYIKPVEQGIREAAQNGVLAGYRMVDFRATLYDGSYHEVDSNEMAFRIAGSMAFREAAKKANPILLEPVMAIEVTVPEEYMGTIIGDINSRRGRIEGMEPLGDSQIIRAIVPLAEVLSSSNYGRPKYAMRFARYEPAPPRNGPFDEDAPAGAKKPWSPRPRAGTAAAEPED